MPANVTVTVNGPTGSGKTAVYMEIMVALKPLGIDVRHADEAAHRSVCNMGEADSHDALAMYKPVVTLAEVNDPLAFSARSADDGADWEMVRGNGYIGMRTVPAARPVVNREASSAVAPANPNTPVEMLEVTQADIDLALAVIRVEFKNNHAAYERAVAEVIATFRLAHAKEQAAWAESYPGERAETVRNILNKWSVLGYSEREQIAEEILDALKAIPAARSAVSREAVIQTMLDHIGIEDKWDGKSAPIIDGVDRAADAILQLLQEKGEN